jgi:hypothetical protein
MTNLPPGYVALGATAVHVAQLRQHTTDVHRFLRCYPICKQLEQHDPGTEPWRDLVRGLTADERAGVALTMREAAALFAALAGGPAA